MNILDKIAKMRCDRNWTEYRLSEESDIPQSTISSWYKKNMLPSLTSLEKISHAFGIPLSQFFSEDNKFVELTEKQAQLLDAWNRLNKKQQDAVIHLIESFNENN